MYALNILDQATKVPSTNILTFVYLLVIVDDNFTDRHMRFVCQLSKLQSQTESHIITIVYIKSQTVNVIFEAYNLIGMAKNALSTLNKIWKHAGIFQPITVNPSMTETKEDVHGSR